jgi:peptide/nickel transport system substrate-binding protein
MKRFVTYFFVLSVLLAGLAIAPVAAQDNTELVYATRFVPDTLDPSVTFSSGVEIIVGHMFDPLVRQEPLGTFLPGLATEWTVNDDATEYIFTLRDDVTFHDGTPFNAEAVKFTFDRIVDPATNSQMAFSFIGSSTYQESEVLDEYTVAVRFSSPNAAFLDGLSHPQLGPVSPTAVAELGQDFGITGVVGTGPFMFESYVPEAEVVMVRNPDYNWGSEEIFGRTGPSDIERIVVKIIQEPSTRLAALESGEVDVIDSVPELDFGRLDADPNFNALSFPQAGSGHSLMFNFEKPPTDELAVRRAIAYAIDKETMIAVVWSGLGTPGCSPLTDIMFGYDPATCDYFSYDPEMAGQILDEAGWVMNEETGIRERDGEPLVIEHYYPQRPLDDAIVQFISEDIRAIGIDFRLNGSDVAAYLEAVRAGQHNSQGWWDTQTDPDGVMRTLFHSSNAGGGTNRNNYRDEGMDMMIDEAVGIADPEARAQAYAEIQAKWAEDVIMVFYDNPVVLLATVANLENVVVLDGWSPNFYGVTYS